MKNKFEKDTMINTTKRNTPTKFQTKKPIATIKNKFEKDVFNATERKYTNQVPNKNASCNYEENVREGQSVLHNQKE